MADAREKSTAKQPLWRWQYVIALVACLAALASAGAAIILRSSDDKVPSAALSGTGNCGAVVVSGTGNTARTSGANSCK